MLKDFSIWGDMWWHVQRKLWKLRWNRRFSASFRAISVQPGGILCLQWVAVHLWDLWLMAGDRISPQDQRKHDDSLGKGINCKEDKFITRKRVSRSLVFSCWCKNQGKCSKVWVVRQNCKLGDHSWVCCERMHKNENRSLKWHMGTLC